MDTNNIGPRIRELRKFRGLSQEALAWEAEALGMRIHHDAIHRCETRQSKPTARLLLAIATALGVTPNDLFRPVGTEVEYADHLKRA